MENLKKNDIILDQWKMIRGRWEFWAREGKIQKLVLPHAVVLSMSNFSCPVLVLCCVVLRYVYCAVSCAVSSFIVRLYCLVLLLSRLFLCLCCLVMWLCCLCLIFVFSWVVLCCLAELFCLVLWSSVQPYYHWVHILVQGLYFVYFECIISST